MNRRAVVAGLPAVFPFAAFPVLAQDNEPSPLPALAAAYRASIAAWDDADDRVFALRSELAAMCAGDEALSFRLPVMCHNTQRQELTPYNLHLEDAWLGKIHRHYQQTIASLGISDFREPEQAKALEFQRWNSMVGEYSAAKNELLLRSVALGIPEAEDAEGAAEIAVDAARDAIFTYRPRSPAELAEKASLLMEIGDECEGWTEGRIAQLLVSLGGKAVVS